MRYAPRGLVLSVALLSTLALFSCGVAGSPTPGTASTARGAGTAWAGTIDSVTFRVYTDNKGAPVNRCQSTWHSAVAFTVTGGIVVGQGTSSLVGKATCAPIAGPASSQWKSEKFGIAGTQQGQSFHVVLHFRSGGGGLAELGGESLLYTLAPCQAPLKPREVVISMQNSESAVGSDDADVTLMCGGGAADQFSNHSKLALQVVKQ